MILQINTAALFKEHNNSGGYEGKLRLWRQADDAATAFAAGMLPAYLASSQALT